MTPLVAGVLAAVSLAYALLVWRRCSTASRATLHEEDELERRLAEKGLALELSLGRRTVRVLGRATLFGGTGLAVWALTGGSTHYPQAALAFVLGFAGWAGCAEVERRVGGLERKRGRGRAAQGGRGLSRD